MSLDNFVKNFWETYQHWYDWTNFHCDALEEGIEIKGIPQFDKFGKISGLYFFDPKQGKYRNDLLERFNEIKDGPDADSGLAALCFFLIHPIKYMSSVCYINSQMIKKY